MITKSAPILLLSICLHNLCIAQDAQTKSLSDSTRYAIDSVSQSKYCYLSLKVNSSGSRVFIDSLELNPDSINNYRLIPGRHAINVSNTIYQSQLSESVYFGAGTRPRLVANMNRKDMLSIIGNCAVPGLRQIKTGSLTEGIAVITGSLAATAFLISSNIKYSRLLRQYNDSLHQYMYAADETKAERLGKYLSGKYADLKTTKRMTDISLGVFMCVLAYQVIDVLLNHYEGSHSLEPILANVFSIDHQRSMADNRSFGMRLRLKL